MTASYDRSCWLSTRFLRPGHRINEAKFIGTNRDEAAEQTSFAHESAIGNGAMASGAHSIAIGDNSVARSQNVVSHLAWRQLVNIAPGTLPTDAATYGQLMTLASSINLRLASINQELASATAPVSTARACVSARFDAGRAARTGVPASAPVRSRISWGHSPRPSIRAARYRRADRRWSVDDLVRYRPCRQDRRCRARGPKQRCEERRRHRTSRSARGHSRSCFGRVSRCSANNSVRADRRPNRRCLGRERQ
jgi:hypothetical protein